jgi:hypothetical protein
MVATSGEGSFRFLHVWLKTFILFKTRIGSNSSRIRSNHRFWSLKTRVTDQGRYTQPTKVRVVNDVTHAMIYKVKTRRTVVALNPFRHKLRVFVCWIDDEKNMSVEIGFHYKPRSRIILILNILETPRATLSSHVRSSMTVLIPFKDSTREGICEQGFSSQSFSEHIYDACIMRCEHTRRTVNNF